MLLNYQEYNPKPILSNYIDHIWVNQFSLGKPDSKETIIPDGMVELVFNFGDPYERGIEGSDSLQSIHGSHIIGIKSKAHFVKVNSGMNTIGVRFKPGGFSSFTNVASDLFRDNCIPASEVFGKKINDLELHLIKAKYYKDKVEIIEKFLLSELNVNNKKEEFINWINTIYTNPQNNNISLLSKDKNVNYKQLERRFIQYLGITPKSFWKIVRFNNALRLWSDSQQANYTELAYNAGYADQSHLIKEFKMFTSKCPGEYFQSETPLSKVIQNTINKQMSNLYNPLS